MYNLKPSQSIGVFDSGMGGLTVLKALQQKLPNENFIYLGDTARLPYGTKSTQKVLQCSLEMAKELTNFQIKALVIACNTATTAALSTIQDIYQTLPVIGVVKPGAEAVIKATKNNKIMVLATETTIQSEAYQKIIYNTLPSASIKSRACSVLVALAEEGLVNDAVTKEALLYYLSELTDQDTLLLGCTHFPVFTPLLKKLISNTVNIVDSADATAHALAKALIDRELMTQSTLNGNTKYFVTDSLDRFQRVGQIFLGSELSLDNISLIKVN